MPVAIELFCVQITEELRANGVQIYQFPTDDETVADLNSKMNVSHTQTTPTN